MVSYIAEAVCAAKQEFRAFHVRSMKFGTKALWTKLSIFRPSPTLKNEFWLSWQPFCVKYLDFWLITDINRLPWQPNGFFKVGLGVELLSLVQGTCVPNLTLLTQNAQFFHIQLLLSSRGIMCSKTGVLCFLPGIAFPIYEVS